MPGDCGSTCPVEGGFYAYNPNIAGNSLLLAAHGILIPAVLYLGIRFRTPVFSAILATGLLLDVVGFVGRLLLSGAPESQAFFVLSLLGTILGPACVSGAIFSTLPHILGVYGDCMSPIRPFLAGLVFYSVVSLAGVIQLIGVVFLAYDLSAMGVSHRLLPVGVFIADIYEKEIGRYAHCRRRTWYSAARASCL